MNTHIEITKKEAAEIAGNYGKYSRIEPVEILEDTFIIPAKIEFDTDLEDVKIKHPDLFKNSKNVEIIVQPKPEEQIKAGEMIYFINNDNDELSKIVKAKKDFTLTDREMLNDEIYVEKLLNR